MKKFLRLSIAGVFSGLLLVTTQATAGRGEASFSQHMSATRVSNEFGHTYRYQKQLGDKPTYQYRYKQQSQWSNSDNKQQSRKATR